MGQRQHSVPSAIVNTCWRSSMPPDSYPILHFTLSILANLMRVGRLPVSNSFKSSGTRRRKRVHLDVALRVILDFLSWMTQVLKVCFWWRCKRRTTRHSRLTGGKFETYQIGLRRRPQQLGHPLCPGWSHRQLHGTEELSSGVSRRHLRTGF